MTGAADANLIYQRQRKLNMVSLNVTCLIKLLYTQSTLEHKTINNLNISITWSFRPVE